MTLDGLDVNASKNFRPRKLILTDWLNRMGRKAAGNVLHMRAESTYKITEGINDISVGDLEELIVETAKYPDPAVRQPALELGRRIFAPLQAIVILERDLADVSARFEAIRNGNGHKPAGESCKKCGSALSGPQAIVGAVYMFVCPNCDAVQNRENLV